MQLGKLNPLGSVFGKIWISFWLSLILIVMAAYFVSFQAAKQYQVAPPAPRHIAILSNIVFPDLGFAGTDAIRLALILTNYNETARFQLYLVDDAYRMLGSPQPPKRILVMLSEMMEQEGMQVGQWRNEAWLGPIPITVNAVNYRLFLRGVPSLPPANLPFWLASQWMQLALALTISGLMSLLLTWSLVRPIEKLRQTVRALARGTLNARAGSSVSRRSDEIGELGRDFDDMATRIEDLVSAQQRLLSNVSHELRSPLTRLQVAMGIVRQKAPEGLDRALDRIERESDRLENMIAQILKLSRFENDMQRVEWRPIELDDIVRKVVEDARFEAEPRQIKILAQIDGPLQMAGDAQLLHSTLDNVVRNALRFSPTDGTIRIALTQSTGQVNLTISDEGPGVPEDKLARLFDPFYRLDQTNPGAGLGLNIALQAVQLHEGKIQAVNNQPHGLTVIIDIPKVATQRGRAR
ncbi:ATP-binding protein [Reinekea sp.]|uniref:ATP-binding protein n=1 Tax=Reinekea sp. TaxID=1970455 RepID=UPI002A81C277|nr:ATP-binding protein [Reinekea sp.]